MQFDFLYLFDILRIIDGNLVPLVNYGVKTMSMGFMVGEDSPIVWRGLMVHILYQYFITIKFCIKNILPLLGYESTSTIASSSSLG